MQVVLTSTALIAIACSSSQSAESTAAQADNATSNQQLTTPASSTTQDKPVCSLSISQAPVIKGLRLGITADEVLLRFPGSKDDSDLRAELSRPPSQFGTSGFMIRPEKYENKAEFTEISLITFTLLDGHASAIHVGYKGPEWPHVDKFVAKFVEGTNLPAVDQWSAYVGLDNQLKILTCTDFEVRVFAGGPGGNLNYVLMQNLEADKKLKERRKKAREQASPTPGNSKQ